MWSERGTEIHEYRGVQTPHHVQNCAWPAERFLAMFIKKVIFMRVPYLPYI
jgi:hypothetical protein